jgi:uncharacterized protein (TIGR00255 family)
MTGYGEAERDVSAGRIRVEIRTVNHRFLNLQLKTPAGFDRHHVDIEGRLRRRFTRGHVTLLLTLDRSSATEPEPAVRLDVGRARAYRDLLQELKEELGVRGRIDVGVITGFRDIFRIEAPSHAPPDVDPGILGSAVEEAAEAVAVMRAAEGSRLGGDLAARLDRIEREVAGVEARAPARLTEERDRLRSAIRDLLDGRLEVDEERIAREVAYLAERWDIHEEIVRLRSHVGMFRETLEAGSPEGVGKRFGFISQEMLREVNTMGSKANDAEITRRVVTLKEEVERIREQLENVE